MISQSVLYPVFIDPSNATIARVVDHVEYIASKISRRNVGLASDFDGMGASVEGMEDASKWPYLVSLGAAKLMRLLNSFDADGQTRR